MQVFRVPVVHCYCRPAEKVEGHGRVADRNGIWTGNRKGWLLNNAMYYCPRIEVLQHQQKTNRGEAAAASLLQGWSWQSYVREHVIFDP